MTCTCTPKQKQVYGDLMRAFKRPIFQLNDALPMPSVPVIPKEGVDVINDLRYKTLSKDLNDSFASQGTQASYYEAD